MARGSGRGKGQCLKVVWRREAETFKALPRLRGSQVQSVSRVRGDALSPSKHSSTLGEAKAPTVQGGNSQPMMWEHSASRGAAGRPLVCSSGDLHPTFISLMEVEV